MMYVQYYYKLNIKKLEGSKNTEKKQKVILNTMPPPVQTKLEPYYDQDGNEGFDTYIPQRSKYSTENSESKLDKFFNNSNSYLEPQPFNDSNSNMFNNQDVYNDFDDIDSDADDYGSLPHLAPPLRPAVQ